MFVAAAIKWGVETYLTNFLIWDDLLHIDVDVFVSVMNHKHDEQV